MTTSNTTVVYRYTGDGTDAVLPFNNAFEGPDDLLVISRVIATNAETVLTRGTHYTVSGGDGASGNVTVIDGATNFPATVEWTILRRSPVVQETDLISGGRFSEQGVEAALDYLTRILQEQDLAHMRTVRAPRSDTEPIASLPGKDARALKALFFDSLGNPVATAGALDPTVITVSTYGETLVAVADAEAGREILDLDAGPLSGRPASGTTAGHRYFATDTGRVYLWDGTDWREEVDQYAFASLPGAAATGKLLFDTTHRQLRHDGAAGLVEVRAPFPRGHLAGLGMTVTGGARDVTIAPGEARAGTAANRSLVNAILATSLTKQLDATWAEGDAAGGLADGVSRTANTWYHVFLLVKPDGTVDAGFDTDVEAANLLSDPAVVAAGYTRFRRIGSLETGGGAEFYTLVHFGDYFSQQRLPISESLANTTGGLMTLDGVPPGVRVWVNAKFYMSGSDFTMCSGDHAALATPSYTAPPLSMSEQGNLDFLTGMALFMTNTSQQIRFSASDATNSILVDLDGYFDARGRFD